jgi:hypothetical protein
MTADELQRWASILRWVGLSVTVIGLLITFGSHLIADRLLVVQRGEKTAAEERLKMSEKELEATKAKTSELAERLAPRKLTIEQRERFVEYLKTSPKGPVGVAHSGQAVETINFAEEIRSLLEGAGFTISSYENPLGYIIKAPAPYFMAVIVGTGERPPYAESLLRAFHEIAIEALPTDGSAIAAPGEVKVYVGAK